MRTLFVVSTPIGNLKDITIRALETLKSVDLILAEDTRITQKLLNHFEIKAPVLSYHQHSRPKKINYILELLKQGKDLALVSDAGTPGISDPGNKLINLTIKQLGNLTIVPVPGPSVLTAAASVSGLPMDKFLFLGFPPQKRKRKKFFQELCNSKYPVIFYESPYRIIKTLEELNLTIKQLGNLTTNLVVCRELTKKFETIYRGTIAQVIEKIKSDKIKGEFVAIVNK
ncbi:MAG: 16S rRNA (cytidine(1402)-2'-O)-methyltransferase [Patescibacteria group bacterium]|nr:16S rRNA (cytidine(1402)-2'-O)-methyltransferase [Patescibacteria group bacterium]